jgi:hypothetical protein
MPLSYTTGDPLQTSLQTLALGHNAKGRTETNPLEMRLQAEYPAAFASYARLCRQGRIKAGGLWLWSESLPRLLFMTIRESAVGTTRLRYVEAAVMTIARDFHLYGLQSVALAPLAGKEEWLTLKPVVDYWLRPCPLEIVVYESGG